MQEWQSFVCERERGWHCVLSALINTESRAPEQCVWGRGSVSFVPFRWDCAITSSWRSGPEGQLCFTLQLQTTREWWTHELGNSHKIEWILTFCTLHTEHKESVRVFVCECVVHLLVHLCTDWMNMNANDYTVLKAAGSFLFTDLLFILFAQCLLINWCFGESIMRKFCCTIWNISIPWDHHSTFCKENHGRIMVSDIDSLSQRYDIGQ